MIRRIRAELGYLRAVLAEKSYIVRPFDVLADRRRWFWQRPTPCRFATGGPTDSPAPGTPAQ